MKTIEDILTTELNGKTVEQQLLLAEAICKLAYKRAGGVEVTRKLSKAASLIREAMELIAKERWDESI